jgi:tRNA pseudouridine synthase 10
LSDPEPAPARQPFLHGDSDADEFRRAAALGLCDNCLGRLYASRGRGYANHERGALVRAAASAAAAVASGSCRMCRGLFARLGFFVDLISAKTGGWEHSTYLVGTKVEGEIERDEETIWAGMRTPGESIRKELNRELGKLYGARAGKEVDLRTPDITVLVDTRFDFVDITVNPLYVRGRYRKLSREIPQTRWPCQNCRGRGRGCAACAGSGRMYATSVEELIGGPLLEATGAEDHHFHGLGREDIDARMLGRGRPFIIEAVRPRRRDLDLGRLAEEIDLRASGKIEVLGLAFAKPGEVAGLGELRPEKSYQVQIRSTAGLDGLADALAVLAGGDIDQRTPVRVSHRRADLVRRRAILAAELVSLDADSREAVINIRASAGAYIKELVHGDNGRTSPSIAGLLARPVEVVSLDVLEVHDAE